MTTDQFPRLRRLSFQSTGISDAGPLDVLVNNARSMPQGAFLDETNELTWRQLEINLSGVITGMLPEDRSDSEQRIALKPVHGIVTTSQQKEDRWGHQ